jgi:hypothetical protein
LEGLGMVMVGIFYGFWYILWPFDNLVAIWYIFPRFGILYPEKPVNHG